MCLLFLLLTAAFLVKLVAGVAADANGKDEFPSCAAAAPSALPRTLAAIRLVSSYQPHTPMPHEPVIPESASIPELAKIIELDGGEGEGEEGKVLESGGMLEVNPIGDNYTFGLGVGKDSWGSVGRQGFGKFEVDVACGQLADELSMIFVQGRTLEPPPLCPAASIRKDFVWFDGLNCTGNEKDLFSCAHPGVGVSTHEMKSTCTDAVYISCKFSLSPSSQLCRKCPKGKVSSTDYSEGSAPRCVSCGVGKYGDSSKNTCSYCPRGRYNQRPASSVCNACPLGTYSDREGLHSCISCGPGRYSTVEGASSSKGCKSGNSTSPQSRSPQPPPSHDLALLAIFKNEALSLEVWLNHYLWQGVTHFFLIDNGSNDKSLEILQPYIDQNLVTYERRPEPFKQAEHYSYFFNKHDIKSRAKWLLMVDLDEFVYGKAMPLREYVTDHIESTGVEVIHFYWVVFGSIELNVKSNGNDPFVMGGLADNMFHAKDPRLALTMSRGEFYTLSKYMFRTNTLLFAQQIEIHSLIHDNKYWKDGHVYDMTRVYCNHYWTQSKAYWAIKIERGSAFQENWRKSWNFYEERNSQHTNNNTMLRDLVLNGYG